MMELRSEEELQRAHDQLAGIILRAAPFPDCGLTMRDLNLMAQVLCWVMRHDHNDQFERTLARIEEATRAMGWELKGRSDDN